MDALKALQDAAEQLTGEAADLKLAVETKSAAIATAIADLKAQLAAGTIDPAAVAVVTDQLTAANTSLLTVTGEVAGIGADAAPVVPAAVETAVV